MSAPCYPLQALLDATGLTLNQLRGRCPTSGRTYRLALDRGLLPDQADRWAVRCGLHPFEVWPEMLDDNLVSIVPNDALSSTGLSTDSPQGCTSSAPQANRGQVHT